MRTIPLDPVIIERHLIEQPRIFFDDPPEKETAALEAEPTSIRTLSSLNLLMNTLNNNRDWKIVKMRTAGLSYESIARQLRIGVATIVRLMRRIENQNPQLGYLLAHADKIKEQNNHNLSEEKP